jgi:hypothetical protein
MSKLSIIKELCNFLESVKVVVSADTYNVCFTWRINYFNSRLCFSSIHLCNILNWFNLVVAVSRWRIVVTG